MRERERRTWVARREGSAPFVVELCEQKDEEAERGQQGHSEASVFLQQSSPVDETLKMNQTTNLYGEQLLFAAQ